MLIRKDVLVKYKMNDGKEHAVAFDNVKEAFSFKGSCISFIRKAIITDFQIIERMTDTSGIISI